MFVLIFNINISQKNAILPWNKLSMLHIIFQFVLAFVQYNDKTETNYFI